MLPRFSFLACLALTWGSGCADPGEPQLYPLGGTVSFQGKPVPGAEMTFHPQFEGPGWLPVAKVAADGSFAAGTRQPGDGALAGKYKVTLVWRPDGSEASPNQLPARYEEVATTPLEVESGPELTGSAHFELSR